MHRPLADLQARFIADAFRESGEFNPREALCFRQIPEGLTIDRDLGLLVIRQSRALPARFTLNGDVSDRCVIVRVADPGVALGLHLSRIQRGAVLIALLRERGFFVVLAVSRPELGRLELFELRLDQLPVNVV